MKGRLSKHNRGSSTLEILIALVVVVSALVASVSIILGNQQAGVDAELVTQALHQAQAQLEDARAQTGIDSQLVVATSSIEYVGPVAFTKKLELSQISLFVKQATSSVSWTLGGQVHSVVLSTLLGNPHDTHGGTTCSPLLVGDWGNPQLSTPQLVGAVGGNPVTGMVALGGELYVSASDTSGHNPDFYIFSLQNTPTALTQQSAIDTNTTTPGLAAVAVASTSSGVYAFVANMHPANWGTCSAGPSCAQVQVVSVSNPLLPVVVKNIKIPATSAPFVIGSGGQAVGNTVAYNNGYLYVGLTKAGSGPEFVIYDVGAQSGSPLAPVYVGSYAVGRGVNHVVVAHGFAYLATADNTREVLVLDIHNPSAPIVVGVFDAPGSNGFGAGYVLAQVGNLLQVGRNYVGNAPEWYLLNVQNKSTVTPFGSVDIGTVANPGSVNGLIVRGHVSILTTSKFVGVYDTTNPAMQTLIKSFNLASNSVVGDAAACEGNVVYVGGHDAATDRGVIYTLYAP